MSTRRILAGACALALALPAAAAARPAVGPFVDTHANQGVAYGSTTYLLQNQHDLGVTKPVVPHDVGVVYGGTAYLQQNQRDLSVPAPHAPRGLAAPHPTPNLVHVVKLTDGQLQAAFLATHPDSKAIAPHLSNAQIAAAFLAQKPGTTTASATADTTTGDWRTAAIVEAALLAALVLGATAIVLSRRRTPGLSV